MNKVFRIGLHYFQLYDALNKNQVHHFNQFLFYHPLVPQACFLCAHNRIKCRKFNPFITAEEENGSKGHDDETHKKICDCQRHQEIVCHVL